MKRPEPKKHTECDQCLTVKPLLMPVSLVPGWPIVVWQLLCLDCRLNSSFDRNIDRDCTPGDVLRFSPHEAQRAAYDEWLAVEHPSQM